MNCTSAWRPPSLTSSPVSPTRCTSVCGVASLIWNSRLGNDSPRRPWRASSASAAPRCGRRCSGSGKSGSCASTRGGVSLRAALETYATRRAVPLVTQSDIERHRARQEAAHASAIAGSRAAADEFFHADLALHEMLHGYGGNRRSARLLADVMGQLSLPSLRAAGHAEHRLAAIVEHGRILAALAARDADAAAAAMASHLEAVKQRSLADLLAAGLTGGATAREG